MPTATSPPRSEIADTLAADRAGVGTLVFLVVSAAAPLTVSAGGATAGFATSGLTSIPAAYLVCGAVLMVFAFGYVAMSRKIVNSGAFYTYVAAGLGRVPGVAAAFVAVVAYGTMYFGMVGGLGAVSSNWLSSRWGHTVPWWVCALVGVVVFAVLGMVRIDINARVLGVVVIIEIVVAVLLSCVTVAHPATGAVSSDGLSPRLLFGVGGGAAAAIAIAGFVGFEGTAAYSEESRDPRRTVGVATYVSIAVTMGLYSFTSWSLMQGSGPANIVKASTDQGSELMFNLAAPHVWPVIIDLGHLLFITSLAAGAQAFLNTSTRYLFALGREGVVFRVLGRTSPRSGVPKNAALAMSGLAVIAVGLYAIKHWDPMIKMFYWLTVEGGFGVLLLMLATSIAVIVYFARTGRGKTWIWSAYLAPALATMALAVITWATVDQFNLLIGVPADAPARTLLPLAFVAAAVIGAIWALFMRTFRAGDYAGIGLGASSALSGATVSRAPHTVVAGAEER